MGSQGWIDKNVMIAVQSTIHVKNHLQLYYRQSKQLVTYTSVEKIRIQLELQ